MNLLKKPEIKALQYLTLEKQCRIKLVHAWNRVRNIFLKFLTKNLLCYINNLCSTIIVALKILLSVVSIELQSNNCYV